MRSSARSPLPRQLSNNQISVSHEISVTSSYTDTPREPSVENSIRHSIRPSFDGSRSNSAAGYRAPSMTSTTSRLRDEVFAGMPHERSYTFSRRSSRETERDRQSLRELSEFLRTKEPPKDNWMSVPENHIERHSKSPFRIFGRKKPKQLQPIQLPDSAVAAKTTEGHWHIAISIPNEYDILDGTPRQEGSAPPAAVKRVNPGVLHSSRDGPITILKPVKEDRPLSVGTEFNAAAIISKVFQDNSPEEEGLQEIPRPQTGGVTQPSNGKQRAYIGVGPDDFAARDSNSDPRHSGGTIYSERSLRTDPSHSRGASSVSTAPSISNATGMKSIDPPTRFSSKTGVMSLDAMLPPTTIAGPSGHNQYRDSSQSAASVAESVSSDFSDGRIGVADTARNPGTPDLVTGRASPQVPRSSGASVRRRLPDLLEGSDDERSSRLNSVTSGDQAGEESADTLLATTGGQQFVGDAVPAAEGMLTQHTSPVFLSDGLEVSPAPSLKETSAGMRGERQERVKALRSRDIAALKEKNRVRDTTVLEAPNTAKVRSPGTPPPNKQAKRRSVSASPSPSKEEQLRRRSENMLTPIMLVADVHPEHYLPQKSTSVTGGKDTRTFNHTPPRSPTPSYASSDQEGQNALHRSIGADIGPNSAYYMHSRQDSSEARLQRAINSPLPAGAHDRSAEFEERLARIEKNNATMMQTLNVVLEMGKGLGELSRLLPPRNEMQTHEEQELERMVSDHVGRGLGEIEPLMRELRGASRISQEGQRPNSFGTETSTEEMEGEY